MYVQVKDGSLLGSMGSAVTSMAAKVSYLVWCRGRILLIVLSCL